MNLKKFKNTTAGVTVLVDGPADIATYEKMCGEVGSVLDDAFQKKLYHAWNPKFRPALAKRLQDETEIEWPQQLDSAEQPVFVEEVDDDGKTKKVPVLISDNAYIQLVRASGTYSEGEFLSLAQEVADSIPVDLSQKARAAKPGKEYYDAARQYLAEIDAGIPGKSEEEFIQKWDSYNTPREFHSTCGEEWNLDSLAMALKINADRVRKAANTDLL